MNLPREYIPKSLRKQPEEQKPDFAIFAIGYTKDMKHFSMAYGPTESLQEMLDIVPDLKKEMITVMLAYPGKNDNWKEGVIYIWSVDENDSNSGIWIKNNKFPDIQIQLDL
jgi:hypothetical protein